MQTATPINAGLHSSFSKIKVRALDYSGENTQFAEVNIDPAVFKAFAHRVLLGRVKSYSQPTKLVEKINIHKDALDADGEKIPGFHPVSILTVQFDESLRSPWKIIIENGIAKANTTATGGTTYASYKREISIPVFLSVNDMETKIGDTLDYKRF